MSRQHPVQSPVALLPVHLWSAKRASRVRTRRSTRRSVEVTRSARLALQRTRSVVCALLQPACEVLGDKGVVGQMRIRTYDPVYLFGLP